MNDRPGNDARRGASPDPDPLLPLPWAEEQRLLGVGVRVERRAEVRARHLPAIAAGAAALVRGVRAGPEDRPDGVVAARLATLRRRLWRVPYWTARLRALGGSPEDLSSLDDLRHLPVLDRDAYARAWTTMFDHDGDPGLHVATSSGTSGQALLVVRSGYDGVHTWAVIRFWIEHLGVVLPERPRLVLLCALPGGLEYSVRAPQLGGGALHRVSTVRPGAAQRLARVRPAVLSTDPAGLHWLLSHGNAAATAPRAQLVLSSAQHLAPSLRAAATAALAAPLVNYFATTETGPIAWECLREPGRFHVLHPDVFVEAVDGELVVTRLRDSPLPLLRYATGDRGEVVDGVCSCGVRGRSLIGFTGRHPCVFLAPDGHEVDAWALSWLFKDLPLVRFELAQVGRERFELRLGGEVPMGAELLALRLRRTLVRLGFARPEIVTTRTELPAAAKPRPFVCTISP